MALAESRTPSQRPERFTFTERQFRLAAHASLFTLTLIIFTGAAVRLTGSGLGCPQWPKCDGGFLPPLSTHHMIEYGNRLVTGVVGIPCLLAAIGAFRLRPRRRDVMVPALILPLGVLVEALIGGATVLLDLKWEVVIAHYVTTCMLLIAAAVLVWRVHREPDAPPITSERRTSIATRALCVFGGIVLVAGSFATAAGPHAGGAGTGDYVSRMTAIALDTMIEIHGHAAAVMGGLSVLLWFYARAKGASVGLMKALTAVCVLIAAQGVIGLIQYYNALPSEVVWVHASLAAVLWLAMVWSVLAAGRPAR